MSAGLASRITEAVKSAMRAHDSTRLGTLRLLQAAIKQKAVDERVDPDDTAILAIIEKQAKQRPHAGRGKASHANSQPTRSA